MRSTAFWNKEHHSNLAAFAKLPSVDLRGGWEGFSCTEGKYLVKIKIIKNFIFVTALTYLQYIGRILQDGGGNSSVLKVVKLTTNPQRTH